MKQENSIDLVKPFARYYKADSLSADKLLDGKNCNVQIVGGINAVALQHPDTIIDVKNKEVIAPDSLYLPNMRQDGTQRDVDILVLSSEESYISWVQSQAEDRITGLEPSVFGYKNAETLKRQMRHPLGYAALKTFLSDRYDHTFDIGLQSGFVKSLFPLAVPINRESMETWTMTVGDTYFPIPNPAMTIINYSNRSISGVRNKDFEKVKQLSSSVLTKAPELRDWALDGPGSSQNQLGLLLRSYTPNRPHLDLFGSNHPILSLDELAEHEAFMLPDLSHSQKKRILAVTAFKAEVLAFAESNKLIVSLFQRFVEKHFDSIVKNK